MHIQQDPDRNSPMWYAIKVRSRREWRVSDWLENKVYQLFLPAAIWTGRQEHPRALFPGYCSAAWTSLAGFHF
jgi:hypothetical protein